MNHEPEKLPILVGVYGSPASLAALRWAAREAALRGVPLHAVRVWQDETRWVAPYASRPRLQAGQEDRTAARAALEQAVLAVTGTLPGADVKAEVADGLPARVLIDCAAHAGLLVLGRATTDALGPVARVCLHRAPCPIVLITLQAANVALPAQLRGHPESSGHPGPPGRERLPVAH